MRHGGILAALAALITAFAVVLAGCGSDDGPTAGTDADDTTPTEARDVILKALETMYTWSPAKDESTLDAYNRALPYLGQELQAGKDNRTARGNTVWWQQWKKQQAEVTAEVLLIPSGHPEDTETEVQRSVMVIMTVTKPDGTEIEKNTLRIDRVVAKKGSDGWRVEEISFFPENALRTATTSSRPTTTVPGRQCPDGSSVPAGQTCGTRTPTTTRPTGTGPTTNGPTTIGPTPIGPSSTTAVPPCPEEQERDDNGVCQWLPCDDPDEIRNSDGECEVQPRECEIEGQTTDSNGTCRCPSGEVAEGGTCVTPCAGDQVRGSDGVCGCPEGTEIAGDSCLEPCPSGSYDMGGSCQYPPAPYYVEGSPGSLVGDYWDCADPWVYDAGSQSCVPSGGDGPVVNFAPNPDYGAVELPNALVRAPLTG